MKANLEKRLLKVTIPGNSYTLGKLLYRLRLRDFPDEHTRTVKTFEVLGAVGKLVATERFQVIIPDKGFGSGILNNYYYKRLR